MDESPLGKLFPNDPAVRAIVKLIFAEGVAAGFTPKEAEKLFAKVIKAGNSPNSPYAGKIKEILNREVFEEIKKALLPNNDVGAAFNNLNDRITKAAPTLAKLKLKTTETSRWRLSINTSAANTHRSPRRGQRRRRADTGSRRGRRGCRPGVHDRSLRPFRSHGCRGRGKEKSEGLEGFLKKDEKRAQERELRGTGPKANL